MSYATILTVADLSADCPARLRMAQSLAQRFNAKLQVVAFGLIHTPMIMSESYSPSMYEAEAAAANQSAHEALDAAKKALGPDADIAETAILTGFATGAGAALAGRALYADLVVLGQPLDDAPWAEELIEAVLFDSPTPALICPEGWAGGAIGDKVTIGWDARKEAGRAVREAWPFLAKASQVDVAVVTHSFGSEPYGEDPGVSFMGWLSHRGISAELRQLEGSPVSDVLLRDAKERGSSLIALGGYGHSRLVESIFGGVTRDLLKKSTVPLLMAH